MCDERRSLGGLTPRTMRFVFVGTIVERTSCYSLGLKKEGLKEGEASRCTFNVSLSCVYEPSLGQLSSSPIMPVNTFIPTFPKK